MCGTLITPGQETSHLQEGVLLACVVASMAMALYMASPYKGQPSAASCARICMHRQAKSTYAQDHTAMVQLKAFLKVSCRHTISCGSVSHIQHRDNTCIHVQNRGQSCKDGHTSLCIQSVTPHRRAPDKMLSSHPDKHFAICCLATVDLIQASTHVQGLSERLSE